MSRRVEFDRLGGPEVLHLVDVEPPHPGSGEVRVRVQAVGLNPLDAKIFMGRRTASPHPVSFPSGNGSDFTGVIDELGSDVAGFELGDAVMGSRLFHAQADFLTIPAQRLIARPAGLDIERAGALHTVGRTAAASVRSIAPGSDDVVLVSAAAGGVGSLAAQLVKRTGATVIGSASESNHDFLRSLGVIPVPYGPGLVDAVRAVAPNGITAALDNHGRESVEAALDLGASADRVNSIADYDGPAELGISLVGGSTATADDLREIAELVAAGELVLPIDSIFPLERVSDAYERLISGHVRGKIVVLL
jgi:enoyl reductase